MAACELLQVMVLQWDRFKMEISMPIPWCSSFYYSLLSNSWTSKAERNPHMYVPWIMETPFTPLPRMVNASLLHSCSAPTQIHSNMKQQLTGRTRSSQKAVNKDFWSVEFKVSFPVQLKARHQEREQSVQSSGQKTKKNGSSRAS